MHILTVCVIVTKVTRYSSVFRMSRMDFTPDEITVTGVLPSSVKSALTSRAITDKFQCCTAITNILLTVTNTQHLNPKLKGTIFFLLAQTVLHYKELTVLYPVWNLTIAWYLNFGWPFEIALSIKYGKIIQLKSWQCLFKIEPPQNLDIPNLLIKTSVMCCIQQICFEAFVFWILWKYVWK